MLLAAQKVAKDQSAALADVRAKLLKKQEECSRQYAAKGFTVDMARMPQPGNGWWDLAHPDGLRHEHPMPTEWRDKPLLDQALEATRFVTLHPSVNGDTEL